MDENEEVLLNPQSVSQESSNQKHAVSKRTFLKGGLLLGAAAATLGLTQFSGEGDKTKEEKTSLIEGIETMGAESPLSQEDLAAAISLINSKEIILKNDTAYATFFITETGFRNFTTRNHETFHSFIKRHREELGTTLKNATPPTSGGFEIRRIIIVQDSVECPDSGSSLYSSNGPTDSDGVWKFDDKYFPSQSAYYNADKRIDFGLLHEWGHEILFLLDDYSCDYTGEKNIVMFDGIPDTWRRYLTSSRNDWSSSHLMGGPTGERFSIYNALHLLKRQRNGRSHDFNWKFWNEFITHPQDLPDSANLIFKNTQGGLIFPDKVTFYASREDFPSQSRYDKHFEKKLELGSGNIEINPIDLFFKNQGELPYANGTIFIRIESAGQIYFRWLDIRDLHLASLLGYENHSTLELAVADTTTNPENFPWSITYR